MERKRAMHHERLILEKIEMKKKKRERIFSRSRDIREDRGVRQRIFGYRR